MRKIKYLIITIALVLFPVRALAVGNITIDKSSIVIESGGKASFNISASNAAGRITISSGNNDIVSVDKNNEWVENQSLTVNVTGVSPGNTKININVNAATFDEEVINKTYTINVTVNAPKSSNNKLSNIKIDGKSYDVSDVINVEINSSNTIDILATAEDSKASVSGTGKKNLVPGKNTFNIVVKAENGATKTYTVVVNKNDSRSSNNYLKSLSIDNGTIDFNKNTTSYTVKVEHNVSNVNISAIAEDNKATVNGTGKKTLKDYTNEFNVVVKAENGANRTYTIKVVRKDSSGNYGKLSTDNSVKSFTVTNYDIKFNRYVKTYNILVDEDVNSIEVIVVPNDSKATVKISGNDKLIPGSNKVIVQVISESGDANEYTLNVYKMGEVPISNEEQTEVVDTTGTNTSNTSNNSMWVIVSIVLSILLIGIVCFIVIYDRKTKKRFN